jgi:hypothetical protein
MEAGNFDIKLVPGQGFLVFPLSMSRLPNALAPERIYEFLEFFESKISHRSVDVVFLYTNDLYFNSEERALDLRKRTLNQMVYHKEAFESLLLKRKRFLPGAFHFLPWDFALINMVGYHEMRTKLVSIKNTDAVFEEFLLHDLAVAGREPSEANLSFLIEELVVSHAIMEHEVAFPNTVASPDGWRLICYPGDPPASLVYLWKKGVLGNRSDFSKQHAMFARSFYNMESRVLIDFERLEDADLRSRVSAQKNPPQVDVRSEGR